MRARSLKKADKNSLTTLQPVNDLHDTKCLFRDENPPFWLFDCGGYVCNQCSFRIVAENVRITKHKCPKCDQDLKNFRFINRYVSAATPEEGDNTVIDLDDVNVSCSGVCLSEEIEMENVNVEQVVNMNRGAGEREKNKGKEERKKKIENENVNENDKRNESNNRNEDCEDENLDSNNNNEVNYDIQKNKNNFEDGKKNSNNNKDKCDTCERKLNNKNKIVDNDEMNKIICNKKETCQICFVLKSSKIIQCESATPHMICSYCYNRMLKIDKVKVCPFCRTKIKKI